MGDNTSSNYVLDLGTLLRQQALEAKSTADASRDGAESDFQLGRLTAYYEVLSLILQQARAFQLAPREVGLEGFDPDLDLLSRR